METLEITSLRHQLHIRRDKLNSVIKQQPDNSDVVNLIQQVDAALERMNEGSYGICIDCHDSIEEDRLLADPLVTVCLGCLSEAQQKALEDDLEFAAKIQRNLLPKKNQKLDGWDFSYHYEPAGAVSGDFTDIIPLNDDSVIFLLGDVSGKGIGASMMMSHLHGLIHSLLSFGLPVNEIVSKANKLFCKSTLYSSYATMALGKASPDGTIEICVAGHNPPILIRNGNMQTISATGMPVGLFCEAEYSLSSYKLNSGDSLLLYTDGLTEARVNEIEYGEEKVLQVINDINCSSLTPKQVLDGILNDHSGWLGETKPLDDITMLCLKRS